MYMYLKSLQITQVLHNTALVSVIIFSDLLNLLKKILLICCFELVSFDSWVKHHSTLILFWPKVNGSHVITRSPVPDFLRTMEILPKSQTPSRIPSLPCVTQDRDWLNSYMRCELPQGRKEFIFAQDIDTVLRYAKVILYILVYM